MCDILENLKNYMKVSDIKELNKKLKYEYYDKKGKKKYSADDVDELFKIWHKKMCEAIESKNEQSLQGIIQEIFNWGGVGSETLKKEYCSYLMNNELEYKSVAKTPLSSWSKVLAAYAPDKYFIYDSRVAIALNVIMTEPEPAWFLPPEKGHNIVFALVKQISARRAKSSYERYCKALSKSGGVALERCLFMLGKKLKYQHEKWRDCIIFDDDISNRE